ncbi:MAG: hypothetical protein PVG08_12785 [Desulfobacterales bacterium]
MDAEECCLIGCSADSLILAFAAEEAHYDFSVISYVNLVAEAIGIRRDDKFKKYTLWGSLERILKDADDHIAESLFERKRIVRVLQEVFVH